jgi:hypothetical protein
MWMYRTQHDGRPIEVYRHAITRHWLHLGNDYTAYTWIERNDTNRSRSTRRSSR